MSFHTTVTAEIARRGRVTFAEFMTWALYHPVHGYYMTKPSRAGRQGDFYTSVQAGPLFAQLLVEAFCEMWDHLGSGRFTLVEVGGGNGALAEKIFAAFQAKGRDKGLSYILVEKGPKALAEARRRLSRFPKVHFYSSLDDLEHVSGVEGCLFSNELFDALPAHRVAQLNGALQELWVSAKDGRLTEEAGPLSTPRLSKVLVEQGVVLSEGQKAEVCLAMDETLSAFERVLGRGFVLTIDYGAPSQLLRHPGRLEGTLKAFMKHALAENVFEWPGDMDITADVDFGRLAAAGAARGLLPLLFAEQGTFLLHSGEKFLRQAFGNSPAPALAVQTQQLLHPGSLGGAFHVLVQAKNAGRPALSGGKINRVNDLIREAA